jgi:rRNA maturation RNase YbeY
MIEIAVVSIGKQRRRMERDIAADARRILRLVGARNVAAEVFLVDDSFMKKNVLAYPAPESVPRPDVRGKFLGEVYVNPDFIERKGESVNRMLVHGLLHLAGYDHERKADRIVMERREAEVLSRLGMVERRRSSRSK